MIHSFQVKMWYMIMGILYPCVLCAQPEKWVVDDALDCSKPYSMTNSPVSTICNPQRISGVPGLSWEKNISYTVLQYDEVKVIKGIKCEKHESTFQFYCGTWSHAVWTEPPMLMRHVAVSQADCMDAYRRRSYRTEHGNIIPIPEGGHATVSYSYSKVGSVIHDMTSAWCKNGKTYENKQVHENLVVMIDAKFSVQEVEFEISPHFLKDLNSNGILPDQCRSDFYCVLPTETYVLFKQDAPECHLNLVRENIQFEQYRVLEGDKKSTFLVSHAHKLLFVDKGERNGYHESCFSKNIPIKITQLHDILLVHPKSVAGHPVPRVKGEGVNIDLEIKVAEAYVLFQGQVRLMNLLQGIDHRFCESDVKTLPLFQRSPFTPNHILRIHGELVQELHCKVTSVEIPLGRLFSVCYNALPVLQGVELKFLTPIDHILLTLEDVIEVPCKLAPKFVVNNSVVSASPRLSTLGLKLTDLTYKYHRSIDKWSAYGINYVAKFTDLAQSTGDTLYTDEEMSEYLELTHFDRKRKEVQSILTSAYCSGQACGGYKSTPGYYPLDFSPLKLTQSVSKYGDLLSPFTKIWEDLKVFLTYFTLYLFLEWIFRTIYAGIQCLQMVKYENFSKKDAVQISFNPGGQVTQTFRDLKKKRVKWADEQDVFTESDLDLEPELIRLADEVAAIRAVKRAKNEASV